MRKVLVVDDEVGALTLIGIMLDRGGFHVLKAQNANQALSMLDRETPDLIILDIMMPGMDGVELCRTIRLRGERGAPGQMPILILSTRNDADTVMRSIDAGATDYLPKPILHHDLVAKVRDMLGMSTAAVG